MTVDFVPQIIYWQRVSIDGGSVTVALSSPTVDGGAVDGILTTPIIDGGFASTYYIEGFDSILTATKKINQNALDFQRNIDRLFLEVAQWLQ